jgi:hypothetical protein
MLRTASMAVEGTTREAAEHLQRCTQSFNVSITYFCGLGLCRQLQLLVRRVWYYFK